LFYVCSVLTDTFTLSETGPDPELRARSLAQLDRLDELAEIGMKAARLVGARAENAGPEEDLNALAMAYARAARAVRLCVMLHAKVIKDLRDGDRADRKGAEVSEAAEREERKGRVENLVYRKAERVLGADLDAIEKLMNEAGERLDYEDLYGDLMSRPIGEMADEISRFLGLGEPSEPATARATVPAGQDLRAPTPEEWSEALAKAAAEAKKVLAELRPDSS
jgi:hypothetical protein